ncbi:uncharacterized protein LOC144058409 [Vanacampus margaritifer]
MLTVAVWLMALLAPGAQGWGLSPPADEHAEPDPRCGPCFRGQTLPRRGGSAPSPRCHQTPGGRHFAALRWPDCDAAVVLAFRLGPGWTQGREGDEIVAIEEDGVQVFIPALLRGGDPESPPTDSPLRRWDWLVATLVRSSVAPQCSALDGDLYILIGDEGCHAGPLWSAACCSVPAGEGGFGVGFISETADDDDDGVRRVSVKELQERLGVDELFYGGCGGTGAGSAGATLGLQTEGRAQVGFEEDTHDASDSGTSESDASESDASESDASNSDASNSDASKSDASKSDASRSHASKSDARKSDASKSDARKSDVSKSHASEADVTDESSVETESRSVQEAGETRSVEGAAEQADDNSSSIVVSIISTALSILKAPLRPIFSRITQFPGQVTYVLQEDLGVLAALPGDTCSLFYLLTSDVLSWIRWGLETLLDFLLNAVDNLYYCVSSMLAALLNSCYTGVTGAGTLAGDTLGLFGGALGKTWRVSRFFGGRLLKQSGDYCGTVAVEMGDQALAVGGGTGLLAWRSVTGVFNMFVVGGSIVVGVVDVVFGAFTEGFGRQRETTPIHTDLSEAE